MSDYGSVLLVQRRNGKKLSSDEVNTIKDKLTLIESYNILRADFGEAEISIVDWDDDSKGFILTRHFLDDNEPTLDEMLQEEEELMAEIAQELRGLLGEEYLVQGSVEDW